MFVTGFCGLFTWLRWYLKEICAKVERSTNNLEIGIIIIKRPLGDAITIAQKMMRVGLEMSKETTRDGEWMILKRNSVPVETRVNKILKFKIDSRKLLGFLSFTLYFCLVSLFLCCLYRSWGNWLIYFKLFSSPKTKEKRQQKYKKKVKSIKKLGHKLINKFKKYSIGLITLFLILNRHILHFYTQ